MSYLTQDAIATNHAMQARVAQAVAAELTVPDPDRWTYDNRRTWAASPDWDAAWEYARNTHPDEPDYDPGKDEAVITDNQILAQVQSMTPTPPPT
jgi:hypothetical protein